MSKQITIILFAVSLLITKNQGRTLSWDDDDDLLAALRAIASSKTLSRRINSMHYDYFEQGLSFRERSSIDDQSTFQQDMLKAHNEYRARHCTPPLELSDELNHEAMEYAKHLAQINRMEHNAETELGENLSHAWSTASLTSVSGADVTKAWYDEIKFYNFDSPQFVKGTGHFTQVVWKDSKQLGAGFAMTSDGTGVFTVARYSPAGNVEGAFEDNVLRPNC